jgi:hypothetical protein
VKKNFEEKKATETVGRKVKKEEEEEAEEK